MPRPRTGNAFRKKHPKTGKPFGPWYARITLADGTRPARRLPDSDGWSEAHAQDAAKRLALEAVADQVVAHGSAHGVRTVGDMLEPWLAIIDAGELAPATKAQHRTNAGRIRDAFDDQEPAGLTVPVLRAWLRKLRGDVSASRTRNVFFTLGRFLDDAAAEGWHTAPNACRTRKVREELPAPDERDDEDKGRHTEAEASKLLASVRVAAPERFVRYVLAFTSGLRDGELAGLTWSSLASEHQVDVLRVRDAIAQSGDDGPSSRRATKTKASRRPVPVHPVAALVLAWWRADGWRAYVGRAPEDGDPILPSPDGGTWRPRSAELFRDDLEAAGLPTDYEGEPLELRSTRRSFCTWLDAHGVAADLQDRLIRHVDRSVRGRHYRGDTPEALGRLASAVATIRLDVPGFALPESATEKATQGGQGRAPRRTPRGSTSRNRSGGSAQESNLPRTTKPPRIGFEDQGPHQRADRLHA